MASPCVYDSLRNAVVENDVKAVAEILRGGADVDLARHIDDEGNLLSIAIESAAVETLALIVGVEFPPRRGDVTLSYDMHFLINSPCDQSSLTPLMKAAKLGKRDMLHLLLCVGAEVNRVSGGKAAIDYSVDPEIVLALLEHDSVLPSLDTDSKLNDFNELISTNDKLEEIFRARDDVHESIGKGVFDSEMMGVFGSGRWVYYVNRKGHSALYTAAMSKNFDALVYFEEQGMLCVNAKEREDVELQKSFHEEMLDRSVRRLLNDIEGSHVMKMFCVSKVFGRSMKGVDARSRVLSYFQHLDEDDSTKVLMQVVQHVPGLIIAFDFDSTGVNRMRASCSRLVHGLTDFDRARVYVGAMETDDFGFQEIVSNLAHELCHMAMWEVYDNGGLPFLKDDEGRGCNYRKMQDTVLDIIKSRKVDRILSRVLKYPEGLHGQELIVRCPEMISKYLKSDEVGEDRLKSEVPDLLTYYEQCVMPDLLDYMDRNFTTNGITERSLMSYQKLLTESQMDGIGVIEDIGKDIKTFIGKHNYLSVLKASNVKLARSHLCMMFKIDGKASPLFVDWSLYLKCRDLFLKGLKSGEIGNLVIAWDVTTAPKFCKLDSCRTASCPGYDFRDYEDCVMLLVGSQWQVPTHIEALSYSWDDLCEETKEFILERRVNVVGKPVMLRKVISPDKESVQVDNFTRDCLDSLDLCLLLEEENIVVGNINSLPGGREGNVILKHPGCFISRTLSQKFVNFGENILAKFSNDIFLLSNVDHSHLCSLGIPEKYIGYWNGRILNGRVRCYILHPESDARDEESYYAEVFDVVSSGGFAEMLHFLKFRQGMFVLIKSINCTSTSGNDVDIIRSLVTMHTVENILKTSAFVSNEALLIADDPGTGKTIYLHQLSKQMKELHPEKWVSVIDLSLQEQQRLFVDWSISSTPESKVADFLFQMVKSGSSALERKVFDVYCRRVNDVVIMFDGFDEICPTYKDVVTSFLLSIRKVNVNIKVFVSTRHHERGDLEKALCAVSYQLTSFSMEEQVTFMSEYWNVLLKSLPLRETEAKLQSFVDAVGRWEVDESDKVIPEFMKELTEALLCSQGKSKRKKLKVNFKPVAKRVMLEQETVLSDLDGFTDTPLHIQMVAALTFEDSLNLSVTENLGHLYLRFFDLKMKIYGREKVYISGNVQAADLIRIQGKENARVLEKLSVNILLDDKKYSFKDDDMRMVSSIGLLSVIGGDCRFVHRTFAEFFFALWMLAAENKEEAAVLWFSGPLVDDSFGKVKFFLDDILSLLSSGVLFSEVLTLRSYLGELGMTPRMNSVAGTMEAMTIPIYALILFGCASILEHFVASFGDIVAKVLLKHVMSHNWQLPHSVALRDSLKSYGEFSWTRGAFENAFSFSAHCIVWFSRFSITRHAKVLKAMWSLLERYEMLMEVNALLRSRGLKWLFPYNYKDSVGSIAYNECVVNFLIARKDIFGDTLREVLFSQPGAGVLEEMCFANFGILESLFHSVCEESQQAEMLSEDGLVFKAWMNASRVYGLERMGEVWEFTKANSKERELLRSYLLGKDEDGMNVLSHMAYYEDPSELEYIWSLGGELMEESQRKSWLFESFSARDLCSPVTYVNWGFHKFLWKLGNEGYLTGDELVRLLMSRDENGQHYILRDYPYGLFNHILPIEDRFPSNSVDDIVRATCIFSYGERWMMLKARSSVHKDLKEGVERIFAQVLSRDVHKLADSLNVDENGILIDFRYKFNGDIHEERFKYFVAVLYKQVELFGKRFGKGSLLNYVNGGGKLPPMYFPNLLHEVIFFEHAVPVGYICSVLLSTLPPEDLLQLLFQVDEDGNSVLHIASGEKFCGVWGKCYDVARALLGENALGEVHSRPNSKGLCVQDLFLRQDKMEEEVEQKCEKKKRCVIS